MRSSVGIFDVLNSKTGNLQIHDRAIKNDANGNIMTNWWITLDFLFSVLYKPELLSKSRFINRLCYVFVLLIQLICIKTTTDNIVHISKHIYKFALFLSFHHSFTIFTNVLRRNVPSLASIQVSSLNETQAAIQDDFQVLTWSCLPSLLPLSETYLQ